VQQIVYQETDNLNEIVTACWQQINHQIKLQVNISMIINSHQSKWWTR